MASYSTNPDNATQSALETLFVIPLWKAVIKCFSSSSLYLNPQSPQATVCCYVGAAALVHFRPGGPGLPDRGFKSSVLPCFGLIFSSTLEQRYVVVGTLGKVNGRLIFFTYAQTLKWMPCHYLCSYANYKVIFPRYMYKDTFLPCLLHFLWK